LREVMSNKDKVVIVGDPHLAKEISEVLQPALAVTVVAPGKLDGDALAGSSLVIEAVADRGTREKVLRRCDEIAPPQAILATTAPLAIGEMAALTGKPDRFLGISFAFSPFAGDCLIQVVKCLGTSEEAVAACCGILNKTDSKVVTVNDAPGLVLDRVMAVLINEAAMMLTTGVSTVEDIDAITKSCLNWQAGPFEFADIIGVDKVLETLENIAGEMGPQFLPCRRLRQMGLMGRLGRKSGRGFYDYAR